MSSPDHPSAGPLSIVPQGAACVTPGPFLCDLVLFCAQHADAFDRYGGDHAKGPNKAWQKSPLNLVKSKSTIPQTCRDDWSAWAGRTPMKGAGRCGQDQLPAEVQARGVRTQGRR